MTFEHEVYDCVRQYDLSATTVKHTSYPDLLCQCIYVPDKHIVFHLIPTTFPGLCQIDASYFQCKTFEYIAHGFHLVHLWQDQWVRKQDIVRSRIAALLDASVRIHARQTIVQRIDKKQMRHFLQATHLQGSVTAKSAYGLFLGEKLVAVASFGAERLMNRQEMVYRSFELIRYASLLYHRVTGGIGKIISQFICDVQPDDIMTYADLDWGLGKSYRTLHFRHVATTLPQMFWIHPKEQIRYYPHRLPSSLTDAFRLQKDTTSMDDFLTSQGYLKIYNAGNFKYILPITILPS